MEPHVRFSRRCAFTTVDGGYSHEFTTLRFTIFTEYGADYTLPTPLNLRSLRSFVLCNRYALRFGPFIDKIQMLRDLQVTFQQHVRDYSGSTV